MRKILVLVLFLILTSSAFAQFDVWVGSEDSIGVDTTGSQAMGWLYPAFLKKGSNITFNLRGDTLMISGSAGSTGSADSLYINDGSTQYSNINNLLKLKEGTDIDIVRSDSTTYDVFTIKADTSTATTGLATKGWASGTFLGDITGVTAGYGLGGGGTSGTVTLNADTITTLATRAWCSGSFLTAEVGDISAVTAGNGISGGGTSGTVTVSADTSVVATKNYVDGKAPLGSSISSSEIVDGTIDSIDIATKAIRNYHLRDSSITLLKLNPADFGDFTVASTATLDAGVVTSTKIATGGVDSVNIASGAIRNFHLGTGAVTGAKIASATIDSSKVGKHSLPYSSIKFGNNPTNAYVVIYQSSDSSFQWYNPASWGYITGNQSISLSGDITGSGTTSITTTIGSGKVTNGMLASASVDSIKVDTTDIYTVRGIWKGTKASVDSQFITWGRNYADTQTIIPTKAFVAGTYFPLAGGQLTGNITFSGAQTVDGKDVSTLTDLGQTIESSEITNGTIDSIDIASKAIRNDHLRDSLITLSKLARADFGDFTVASTATLDIGVVDSVEMASGSVRNFHLATGSVNSSKITDASVDSVDIATNAIRSYHIQANTILKADMDTTNTMTFLSLYKKNGGVSDSQFITWGRNYLDTVSIIPTKAFVAGTYISKTTCDFFTLDDPSVSVGTDDSVFIQYPIQFVTDSAYGAGCYPKVWYHYNPSAQADQYDTLVFVTRVPMWFTGWDSVTYNYKTSSATNTVSNLRVRIYKKTVDGGASTFIDSSATVLAATSWTHVTHSAKTVTAGNWLVFYVIARVDATQGAYHDKPYVWGKR